MIILFEDLSKVVFEAETVKIFSNYPQLLGLQSSIVNYIFQCLVKFKYFPSTSCIATAIFHTVF